jgi:hypothetical protein
MATLNPMYEDRLSNIIKAVEGDNGVGVSEYDRGYLAGVSLALDIFKAFHPKEMPPLDVEAAKLARWHWCQAGKDV